MRLLVLLLCTIASVYGYAPFPLALLRLTPDHGTLVAQNTTKLFLAFNQPLSETPDGYVSIIELDSDSESGKVTETVVFRASVRGRNVWVRDATVTIDLAYGNSSFVPFFQLNRQYSISANQGAWVADVGASPSPEIGPHSTQMWTFMVTENGPPFYPSDIPQRAQHPLIVKELLKGLNDTLVLDTIKRLAAFPNRFFQSDTGLASAKLVRETLLGLAHSKFVEIDTFQHAWKMPSTVARLIDPRSGGLDDDELHEVIILGAHVDSINRQNWTVNVETGIAPGANDDASGVAILIEIFRNFNAMSDILAKLPRKGDERSQKIPYRDIHLHFYSAEEEGLYGSADLAADYARRGIKVAADLQLDQCAYLHDPQDEFIGVFTDDTDPALTSFVKNLIDVYANIPWRMSNEEHRADSDFHSWHVQGYRAAYIAEGDVDDIVYGNNKHTAYDLIDNPHFSLSHAMELAKVSYAFLLEMILQGHEDSGFYLPRNEIDARLAKLSSQ